MHEPSKFKKPRAQIKVCALGFIMSQLCRLFTRATKYNWRTRGV